MLIPFEKYEPNDSPNSYGQIEGQTGFFNLGMPTGPKEIKLNSNLLNSTSKNRPCVLSYSDRVVGRYMILSNDCENVKLLVAISSLGFCNILLISQIFNIIKDIMAFKDYKYGCVCVCD